MPCMYVQPPTAVFLPVGMTKNGTFQINSTTTYTQIPAWLADPAFPGSVVASDSLVVQSASSNATIAANIPYTASISAAVTLRLFLNGTTQIAQGVASASGTSGTAVVSVTGITVAPGDLISVQGITSSSFGATVVSGTGTWVQVTAP